MVTTMFWLRERRFQNEIQISQRMRPWLKHGCLYVVGMTAAPSGRSGMAPSSHRGSGSGTGGRAHVPHPPGLPPTATLLHRPGMGIAVLQNRSLAAPAPQCAAPSVHPSAAASSGDASPAGRSSAVVTERAASSPAPFSFFDSLGAGADLSAHTSTSSAAASPREDRASPRDVHTPRSTGGGGKPVGALQGGLVSSSPLANMHRRNSSDDRSSVDVGRSVLFDVVASSPVRGSISAVARQPGAQRAVPQQVPLQPPTQQLHFSSSPPLLGGFGGVLGGRDAGFGFAAAAANQQHRQSPAQQVPHEFEGPPLGSAGGPIMGGKVLSEQLSQQPPTPSLAGWQGSGGGYQSFDSALGSSSRPFGSAVECLQSLAAQGGVPRTTALDKGLFNPLVSDIISAVIIAFSRVRSSWLLARSVWCLLSCMCCVCPHMRECTSYGRGFKCQCR